MFRVRTTELNINKRALDYYSHHCFAGQWLHSVVCANLFIDKEEDWRPLRGLTVAERLMTALQR